MMSMTERHDATPYDPAQFLGDLQVAAASINAPFDRDLVSKTLDVFDAEFRRCVVQLKATSQPNTGIYYRFFYKWERDLTALAQRHGMIPEELSPIVNLQQQVLERFAGATRAGLDFDTSFGLAKIWTFTGGPTSLDELLELSAIPEAVRRHRNFFARHGLRRVFFVASDVQQRSMNVYFGLEDDCRTDDWIYRLANEMGGAPEDAKIYKQMVTSLAVSAGVGTTFRWDDDAMGRWCLYGLNLPCDDPRPELNMPPLPERLRRFQQCAPTLNASPQYNIAWSFGKAGYYTKLEKSYSKDADFFLTHEMGGNLTHPAASWTNH